MSRDTSYFREIHQITIRKGEHKFALPLFDYESSGFGVVALAKYKATKRLLPSPRLEPLKLPGNRTPIMLFAFEHRDSDLGEFNEFIAALPVKPLAPGKRIGRLLPWLSLYPSFYILHRVVNNARAFTAFGELFSFPVTQADVHMERYALHGRCHVAVDNDFVIVMEAPCREGSLSADVRADFFSARSNRLLRSEQIGRFYGIKPSLGYKTKITTGRENFIARDLREIGIGRPIAGWYIPHIKSIITNPMESFPIEG